MEKFDVNTVTQVFAASYGMDHNARIQAELELRRVSIDASAVFYHLLFDADDCSDRRYGGTVARFDADNSCSECYTVSLSPTEIII